LPPWPGDGGTLTWAGNETSYRKGPWTIESKQDVYDNRWIRVTHHEVVTPAGPPGIYGTVHFKNLAVGIVPIDSELHTYLVGQYRFPLERYSWEIPEGGRGHDLGPQEGAARELREETGLSARRWLKLLECDLSNAVSDERAVSFIAWDLVQGASSPEPTEELVVKRVPLLEAFELVASGEIRDALSIVSLQAVQLMYLQKRVPSFL
jgi:8-oxo-dGTP pyrophosphatase MutT (NUDIX family)